MSIGLDLWASSFGSRNPDPDFARKTFWECWCSWKNPEGEGGHAIPFLRELAISCTVPQRGFTMDAIKAGSEKDYAEMVLPADITVTLHETADYSISAAMKVWTDRIWNQTSGVFLDGNDAYAYFTFRTFKYDTTKRAANLPSKTVGLADKAFANVLNANGTDPKPSADKTADADTEKTMRGSILATPPEGKKSLIAIASGAGATDATKKFDDYMGELLNKSELKLDDAAIWDSKAEMAKNANSSGNTKKDFLDRKTLEWSKSFPVANGGNPKGGYRVERGKTIKQGDRYFGFDKWVVKQEQVGGFLVSAAQMIKEQALLNVNSAISPYLPSIPNFLPTLKWPVKTAMQLLGRGGGETTDLGYVGGSVFEKDALTRAGAHPWIQGGRRIGADTILNLTKDTFEKGIKVTVINPGNKGKPKYDLYAGDDLSPDNMKSPLPTKLGASPWRPKMKDSYFGKENPEDAANTQTFVELRTGKYATPQKALDNGTGNVQSAVMYGGAATPTSGASYPVAGVLKEAFDETVEVSQYSITYCVGLQTWSVDSFDYTSGEPVTISIELGIVSIA